MSEKAVFLDRDDTLIVDPGYINDPDQVRLIAGVPDALIQLRELGFKLVVVSNQSAVARGIVSEKKLGLIHDKLEQLLAEKGAKLDAIYYCPYHPDGSVPRYRKASDSRKPAPGMLLDASDEMDIDLKASWMIGNSGSDIEAGRRAGCTTILVDPPTHEPRPEDLHSNPNYRAINLKEALNIIKHHCRTASMSAEASQARRLPDPGSDDQPQLQEPDASVPEETRQAEPEKKPQPRTRRIVFDDQPEQPEPAGKPSVEPEPVAGRAYEDIVPRPRLRLPTALADSAAEPGPQPEDVPAVDDSTRSLLTDILEQLRILNRHEMFDEFSPMRFFAGIIQVLAIFALVVTVWFILNPTEKGTEVFIALGFAAVLQVMSLTFYIMQGRK